MTLTTFFLYLAAVAVLIVTPGPTMLMCVANAINHGQQKAIASGAGALVASFAVMALRQGSAIRWINRTCGTLFALLGGMLLLVRRSA